jgi:hypothetical protein
MRPATRGRRGKARPLERARLEVLAPPHQDRRPAKLVARGERLHSQRVAGRLDLEGDAARDNQVELVGVVAFAKDHLVARELDFRRE